jgi:hypothetical protein
MQHHAPSTTSQIEPRDTRGDLPVLELPPIPFLRATSAPATIATQPVADSIEHHPLPAGTTVQDLLGALVLDGVPPADAHELATGIELDARPHHEFSVDVERRAARERRREHRATPDRRAFTSEHLAAPAAGPVDPRPTMPPVHPTAGRPSPIDAVMPPLPLDEELQPVRAYELPSRGVAATTQRTTRASVAIAALPFPQQALDHPPQPTTAPEPPVPPAAPAAPAGIEAIFGPAGPAAAPGAGLDPIAAAVAAAPSAWFGEAVHVDDELLVWNAPVAVQTPLAATVAAQLDPTAAPATGAASATTFPVPLTPLAPAAATAPATRRRPARLALLVGVPAAAGIAIAVAAERFLL